MSIRGIISQSSSSLYLSYLESSCRYHGKILSCFYAGTVAAINSLYVALGSPLLPGWVGVGGDPCADSWQGVQCIDSNISAM